MSDFERMYVGKHNELRARTGAGPLTLDRTMADYAQNHVNPCVFEHSSPRKYGENLGAGYPSIAASIQAWFDEWTEYPFDKPDFYPGTGHFTQVVWKAATKIGCAQKVCNGANGTPGTYYSCNYDEGNLIGSFDDNVSAPKS
ncbi:CAP domain-containing protein [Terfezia claveryi]|nr:CAP domain-containing protein [Terfezia claveryi]